VYISSIIHFFDEIQEKILLLQTPLIIIGAAGSGKTALVLSKLKKPYR